MTYTSVNSNIWIGTLTGSVSVAGTLSLTGRLTSARASGVLFLGDVADWSATLSPSLGMTGRYSEVITWVGERDQGFVTMEILRATR